MIALVALLVMLACAGASARRLWIAANPTALEPETLLKALEREPRALQAFQRLATATETADWERDLAEAMTSTSAHRAALVNEQLTELDRRMQRWVRVPRVCASVSTSFGFLLATLVLRRGLTDAGSLPADVGELAVRGLIADALTVAALGIVGTAFCVAAQAQARRMVASRAQAADRLIERLERAASDVDAGTSS